MKKILCATDYSENAEVALKYAYAISKKLQAKLVVTHVFDYPTILGTIIEEESFPLLEKDTLKQQQTKLETYCMAHLGTDLKENHVEISVLDDKSVLHGLISKIDEIHAFMVVVGMKGATISRELIMGSVTKQLIDKANSLVVAVPSCANYKAIETIVYATDFETDKDIEVIQKLTGLANAFDATIKVVHISTEKGYSDATQMGWFETKLKEKVKYDKISFKVIVSETVFESLKDYLDNVEADMVVMLERKEKGIFKKIFHQDLVKKMEIYGKIPLVSFNEENFGMFDFINLK
ncbi:hypothetical protein DNU06_06775 [Putridiphycobacter roseus]|uniref:UspA domain-containing protein n=1 Tax=Putridiphycobacter roseus TaxID=2219161 RepID=A0A2W1NHX5_9FLAO|nr:universal stress protein [Putridiphycobacter roseus]PZE17526.1 hypothetical protein DNU06_06775 [Putridiphycobacter roseus]